MVDKIARKINREEKGFTLIELMVVVLIIGILIAIALPTFLGARKRAQDKASLSDLRNGIASGKTYFTDSDTYVGFNTVAANLVEPSLKWVDGAPGAGQLGIITTETTATNFLLVRLSDSGTYFCLDDQAAPGPGTGTHFGKGDTTYASVNTVAKCAALPAP